MNSINKNIKSFFILFCLTLALVFSACGGSSKHDKFVLNEDYTGTIQFAGNDKQDSITWSDGPNHQSPFATIKYNGDPSYYYLRDGKLYRHEEDMDHGKCSINITYDE